MIFTRSRDNIMEPLTLRRMPLLIKIVGEPYSKERIFIYTFVSSDGRGVQTFEKRVGPLIERNQGQRQRDPRGIWWQTNSRDED
jgi:hypothetical protein